MLMDPPMTLFDPGWVIVTVGVGTLQDNEKTQVVTDRMLTPAFCLRKGERFDADASILPVAQAA